ncbi:MAG TPA: Ig-like domain-containing protein [Verrucomicrobiae bacterium]|nr:Ig-like domain-containing protein [Verrucomicrobiae bacterium]
MADRHLRRPISLVGVGLLAAIAFIFGLMTTCEGLPKNVADCPITPTPPSNLTIVPAAQIPPPQALCPFPMTITSPANGVTVTSPTALTVVANAPDPLYTMRVYVDGEPVLYSFASTVNQFLWMSNGQHTVEAVAEDVAGYISTASLQVNVTGQTPGISNIQNLPGWTSCSAVIGAQQQNVCAAGLGNAVSTLTQAESSPSLDGSAAEFSLAGPSPYSNELYWVPLGGGTNVSHFIYDLYFYVSEGNRPQALEFDINQAFGNTRWTWGSECDFNQTKKWNIWNPAGGVWVPTYVDCKDFPSNTWIHLIWTVERVGNQVHYINLNVAGTSYNIDTYYNAQPNWYQQEIDVAFQMDGNYAQQPYDVWLDEVTLNGY